jgi:hypothetical protein
MTAARDLSLYWQIGVGGIVAAFGYEQTFHPAQRYDAPRLHSVTQSHDEISVEMGPLGTV